MDEVFNQGYDPHKTWRVKPMPVMPERKMSRIKAVFKNKYFGYLLDLAVVFIAVAILSSGTGFVLDHRVLVLVLLVVIIVIRGIS